MRSLTRGAVMADYEQNNDYQEKTPQIQQTPWSSAMQSVTNPTWTHRGSKAEALWWEAIVKRLH
jgi:hypothetical protein